MNGELKAFQAMWRDRAENSVAEYDSLPGGADYFAGYADAMKQCADELGQYRPTPAPGALPELPEAAYHRGHQPNHSGDWQRGDWTGPDDSTWKPGWSIERVYTADQMHAYARAYAEQCRAEVVVTDAMVELALDAMFGTPNGSLNSALLSAIGYADMYARADRAWCNVYDVSIETDGTQTDNREDAMRAALQSAFADDEGVKRG